VAENEPAFDLFELFAGSVILSALSRVPDAELTLGVYMVAFSSRENARGRGG
jgi:hypothetical protein